VVAPFPIKYQEIYYNVRRTVYIWPHSNSETRMDISLNRSISSGVDEIAARCLIYILKGAGGLATSNYQDGDLIISPLSNLES
jgi:hypothetical protein